MIGSLAEARVLYAPVEEIGGEGRLLRACGNLVFLFHLTSMLTSKLSFFVSEECVYFLGCIVTTFLVSSTSLRSHH